MVCENCKHNIGPEELKCPNCGAINPFAVQHEKNMEQFAQEYANTEKEVSGFAKAVEGLGKKAAILLVLLIGIIVMNIISSLNYADPDEDKKARRDAEKHLTEYAEKADGYLQCGEYMEYVSFLYAHELMNFQPDEFARFRCVTYVAKDYYECMELMEAMILRSDNPDYWDGLDTDIRNFCMYLEDYYEVLEAQKSSEKSEEYLAYILDIDTELQAAMRTYFAMDEDELQEFQTLSQAQKAVKIREVLRHE